jgi:hypothetical protein
MKRFFIRIVSRLRQASETVADIQASFFDIPEFKAAKNRRA